MSDAPENTSIQDLLQQAAAGDEVAWEGIVKAYYRRVYALIRAQAQNPDLAEEITQSTFHTIVVKLADYTEIGRFEPWLFRIAMNRLRDELRRRKRQATAVEDDALAGLVDAGLRGPRAADAGDRPDDEQKVRLRDALRQLSEVDQRIVYLRHCAGLSFKQIAELQDNQPIGTVLARHHRALKKLRDLMETPTTPVSDG
ncbi:MAG: sigma-70 family RNA polymerase sigma factor [Phycisphaerales bacterium]|nr:sigma-70 family RNA polymerase sigma factor [Phycisphaerales bacterium]